MVLGTIRITVETDTFLVVRRAKAALAWCPECCAKVDVITLTRDSISEPATAAQVERWLPTSNLHLWHSPKGAVQICVTSLLLLFRARGSERPRSALFQAHHSNH